MIESLTPEQEALIPVYREKWRKIAFSTDAIDVNKATAVINALYERLDREKPEILFFENPKLAIESLKILVEKHNLSTLYLEIEGKIYTFNDPLFKERIEEYSQEDKIKQLVALEDPLYIYFVKKIDRKFYLKLHQDIYVGTPEIYDGLSSAIMPNGSPFDFIENWETLIECVAVFDFCINVLGCEYPQKEWNLLQDIVKYCGWLITFEDVCGLCDRPSLISVDRGNFLHAEGKPALQYRDGLTFYFYHGTNLPEQYGKVPPTQWQSQWLLSEKNAELRRIFIHQIGYDRICQELNAIPLDSWQEYTLLKIDSPIDIEPIYLLKMTCPSMGFIHAIRVPPNVESAKAAITWINWGISPEAFSIQT